MSWIYKTGFTDEELPSSLKDKVARDRIFGVLKEMGLQIEEVNPEEMIRANAESLIGKPYKNPSIMRIDAPEAFSCSSFVSYVYTLAGIWMPSISVDKYVFGLPIAKDELRYGDLIFSNTGEIVATGIYHKTVEWMPGTPVPEGVDHLGIYIGDNKLVHASRSTSGVMIEDIDTAKNFGEKIVGYRRIADLSIPRFVVSIPDSFAPYQDKKKFLAFVEELAKTGDLALRKYDVPYFSQLTDIGGDFWAPRACGSTSLAMAMACFGKYDGGKEGLLKFCDFNREQGAYIYPLGWFRGKLAEIARKSGLLAEVVSTESVEGLANEISAGKLALLSINKTILGRKRAHIVLCVGVLSSSTGEPLGFLIHDPESTSTEFGAFQFVSPEDLSRDWISVATYISEQ
jgi:lipoprotein Spr